jgi:predicted esterase
VKALRIALFAITALAPASARAEGPPAWWPVPVDQALARAGDNRPELLKALTAAPADQRAGMAFLVANMPERDLRTLRADFLTENVALAYRARNEMPWGKAVPEDLFLNDVLPYANVDEARHPWRKELFELCLPMVKDCKTPGEAAQKLNSTLFKQLKVKYSTQRRQPHQSPKESIETGLASCTGLSILLCDGCRSVGVPARLAGTPMWANLRGNHTWVEVWDDGWHFTGACEPDPKGLDRGWFVNDAAQAKKDSRQHAIYAASFKRTDVTFPLVWAPNQKDVFAENVTDRYARPEAKADRVRVQVLVWEAGRSKRLALPVTVAARDNPAQVVSGESRGETADTNDILAIELLPDHDYVLRVGRPARLEQPLRTGAAMQQLVEVELPKEPAQKPGLPPEAVRQIEDEAKAIFAAGDDRRAGWKCDARFDRWLADHEPEVRRAVWAAYRAAPVHEAQRKDFDANRVRTADRTSPYVVREVGTRPERGWPLVIAMHGGGNGPTSLNDSQWKAMQRYYRDQPSAGGYKYLALRAPNDAWNGFYDDPVLPLITSLIRQFLLFGDVDPDRVYLIGYSHGGYGAFFIGPKLVDRFAAVHCSAAAPTDGTISPQTLRNTRFTIMVGETDTAYGRRERCEKFAEQLRKLKEQSPGEFPVEFELKKGFGHGGLPDRDKVAELARSTRNPAPRHLTWEATDAVVAEFFWLSVDRPAQGQSIEAELRDNTVRVTTRNVKQFDLGLDSRLVDFGRPLRVTLDGKAQEVTARPSLATLCRSVLERGDPELAVTCRVRLRPGAD